MQSVSCASGRGSAATLREPSARAEMVFRAWKPGDPLRQGVFHTREPMPDSPVAEPCVVLTPLLAFDRLGTRLGYGGGFYDRALQTRRLQDRCKIRAWGVGWSFQETARLPRSPWDAPLDAVITEREGRFFPPLQTARQV